MRASPLLLHRLGLLGLGLLAAGPLAAQTPILTNNGGTLFVNNGGVLTVNGGLSQTGAALLRTTGTATVAGDVQGAAAATLDLDAGQLSATGNVAHLGPTAGTTGTLRLAGTAAQTLSTAGGTVPNLNIDKATGTATLSGPVQVRQRLAIAGAGDLDANGQALTLLSDATGTALVANLGTGQVQGDVTVQRYIDPTRNPGLGYRHLVFPTSGQSVASFGSGGTAPVVNAAYNTATQPGLVTPFPTVFRYNQDRLATSPATSISAFDKGWNSPTSLVTTLQVGRVGFTVQLPGASTLSFTGELQASNRAVVMPMQRGPEADAGWQFIGNPYAAPLDWSTVGPSQRTNIDAAMYVFESTAQYAGQYRSYVNGVGGGNPLIGSSQGFWVRVSAGQTSGVYRLNNTNRVTDYNQQVPVRRGAADSRPQLQLTLAGAGAATDALYLYSEAGATAAVDAEYDATKLANATGLNLASLTATGQQLAIDGRPAFTAATSIPLFVGVPAAGRYTLTAAALANLAGTRAELVDNLTGTRTLLTAGVSYAFTMTAYTAPGRFWLNLTPAAAPLAASAASLEAQVLAYPNPAHGQLTVLRPAGKVAAAMLLNSLGQKVRTLALPTAETTVDLRGLASGVYTLRLTLNGQPVTRRVVVD